MITDPKHDLAVIMIFGKQEANTISKGLYYNIIF